MTVTESVAALIRSWLLRSKINNLNLLSQRSQVPYSTVYRLSKAQNEKPPVDAVVGVLSIVASAPERADFLQTYYPSLYAAIEQRRQNEPQLQGEVRMEHPVLDVMMSDPIGFMLAQQILSKAGVATDRVAKQYGEYGLNYLETMMKEDLVFKDEGRWHCPIEYSNPTLPGNKAQIITAVNAWNLATHETGCSLLETRSESVSLVGAFKIKQVMQAALKEVRAIHEENPGNHTYVLNLALQLADPQLALQEMGEAK